MLERLKQKINQLAPYGSTHTPCPPRVHSCLKTLSSAQTKGRQTDICIDTASHRGSGVSWYAPICEVRRSDSFRDLCLDLKICCSMGVSPSKSSASFARRMYSPCKNTHDVSRDVRVGAGGEARGGGCDLNLFRGACLLIFLLLIIIVITSCSHILRSFNRPNHYRLAFAGRDLLCAGWLLWSSAFFIGILCVV